MRTAGSELTFRRGDLITIIAVVVIALGMLAYFLIPASPGMNVKAQVYLNGEFLRELSLSEDRELALEGAYHNTITVREGKIAITESDCPGEDCVHTGWVSRSGMSIVCLPNRVEIRLVNAEGEDEVDMMVW